MKPQLAVFTKTLFVCLICSLHYSSNAQLYAAFGASPVSGCSPFLVTFTDSSQGNPTAWKWDLGNGVISNQQNPSTTYFEPGIYTVKLIIYKDAFADSTEQKAYITVYDHPHPSFRLTDSTGCYPLAVSFVNQTTAGSGSINETLWDFGDGNVSSEQQPKHVYSGTGTFDITLKVTNSTGCTSTITKNDAVTIQEGVKADFIFSTKDVCHIPVNVIFSSNSSGTGALSYSWNLGDGASSLSANLSHSYNKPGNYRVLLKVTNAAGCSDTLSKNLVISGVTSSFLAFDSLCSSKQFLFQNTSFPAPIAASWTFGDGTGASEINPLKAYSNDGIYIVKLVSQFTEFCTDSITKKITVIKGTVASFTLTDSGSCQIPFTEHFKNNSKGAVVLYNWNFGDGSTSDELNPVHIYDKFGSYTVTLKAINSNGCADTIIKQNAVAIQPLKITGISGIDKAKQCIPFTIQPEVLLNVPVKISKYHWDFGNGSTSDNAGATAFYTKEGNYTIKVTVETAEGCSASYTLANAVSAGHKPVADFTVSPLMVCAGQSVTLTSTSTNGPIHFLAWNDGGKQPASQNPTLTSFDDTGYVSITLKAFNYGCADSLTKLNMVYVKGPAAKMGYSVNCLSKYELNFFDSSVDDATYNWSFGDGRTDTSKNPVHIYPDTGRYTVLLTVTKKECTDTTTKLVRVINEKGIISILPNILCSKSSLTFNMQNVNPTNIAGTYWKPYPLNNNYYYSPRLSYSLNYSTPGVYKIVGVLKDMNGCTDTLHTNDSVVVYGPLPRFNYSKTAGCIDSSFNFSDASVSTFDHSLTEWTWDFGDGSRTTLNEPIKNYYHQYRDTGTYDVMLKVTDSYGCKDSIMKKKLVSITQPNASFSVSDSLICPEKELSFVNHSTGKGLKYSWDFGDGGALSDSTEPSHVYPQLGYYLPMLKVTDINGCKDTFTGRAILVAEPIANFHLSDTFSNCPPLIVDFTNSSEKYAFSDWSFGDGSSSTLSSPKHIFTYPGVYQAKLISKGVGTCTATATKNIIIQGPQGILSYDPAPRCVPAWATLNLQSSNAVDFVWDFGDGQTSAKKTDSVLHSYQPGNFIPKIILSDSLGCKVPVQGIDTLKIFSVAAKGSISDHLFCDSTVIDFRDSSSSNDEIINRSWLFGDGLSGIGTAITHHYSKEGTYPIQLVTGTKNGCSDTFTIDKKITVVQTPVISIAGDALACEKNIPHLYGSSAFTDSSLIWNWNFGNGITGTGQTVHSIIYQKAGNYELSLIAKTPIGCSDTAYKNISVRQAPPIDAGIDTLICRQQAYTLHPSGGIKYNWKANSFLNCSNCTNTIIQADSSSMLYVTGTDAFGCTADDSVKISVIQPTKVYAAGNITCPGQPVQLKAGGAEIYQWFPALYLNDIHSATPVFMHTRDSLFTYIVVGSDHKNCFSDTAKIQVQVYPIPTVELPEHELNIIAGMPTQLSAKSSPDVTHWLWRPARWLSSTTIANPVASTTVSTNYECIGINDAGCSSSDIVTIHALCGNNNFFVPNTFSPNGDGANDIFYARGTGLFNIRSCHIFNRWGQLVFESNNMEANNPSAGWNGIYQGKALPADAYVFMMEVVCENKTVIPVKGSITLLR